MRIFTLLLISLFSAAGLAAQTPELVQDIFPGDMDGRPSNFFNYGDQTLFTARTPDEGNELWITDGTAAGTRLVKDINDDASFRAGNSNPGNFTEYAGKVYFTATAPVSGRELWVTDGTADGTTLVTDIQPGEGNGNPFDFIVYQDSMYFTANNGNDANSSELWVSGGDEASTRLVVDINPGGPGNPINKFEYAGFIFFAGNDGVNGRELWFTDGTAAGTALFFDINEGPGNSTPADFLDLGGRLIFGADNGEIGRELYNFNLIANTIGPIFDLNTGEDDSRPRDLFNVGNRVFFTANTADQRNTFNFVDFSAGQIFIDFVNQNGPTNPRELTEVIPNQSYIMVVDTGAQEDQSAFYFVENTGGGLFIGADDVIFEDLGGADPQDLVFSGSSLYFSYETDATGREVAGLDLFVAEAPVTRFGEVNAGAASGDIDDLHLLGTKLLFEATNGATGDELYALDVNSAIVTLEDADGETINRNDTLDFGNVDIGVVDSVLAIFNNTGNFNSRLFTFTGLFDTDVIAPVLRNTDPANDEQLRPAPDNAYISFLLLPQREGEFLDTALVTFTTAEGPSTVRFLIKGNVVAPSIEAFADDVRILQGDTISFSGTPTGQDSTRVLTLNNVGQGNFIIRDAAITGGANFSIPTPIRDTLATGEAINIPITFDGMSETQTSDSLLIFTNIGTFNIILTGDSEGEAILTVVARDRNLNSGDAIEFTDVPARTDSTVNLIVANSGTGSLTVDSLSFLVGELFSTTARGFTLPMSVSDTIPITFRPTAVGEVTDVLTLFTTEGQFVVNLTGISIINSVVDRGLPAKAVYPNPTTGNLRLELETPILEGNWRVVNPVGQVVSHGVWPSGQAAHDFDLSTLTAGTYQVEVTAGDRKLTARVIKL